MIPKQSGEYKEGFETGVKTGPYRESPQHTPPGGIKGRGSSNNATGRFESIVVEPDADSSGEPDFHQKPGKTRYLRDHSRSILSYNKSPDVAFSVGINPYRGCEHGCAYCFARPTHEYLGHSAGLDFERNIYVKEDAPGLLRQALLSKKWKPQTIALSGNTDPYQPVEKKLKLTRACLEVLAAFRNPVGIITKNFQVTRDGDLLRELAEHRAAVVMISLTTTRDNLRQKLEPRTSAYALRLKAIETLARAGVPAGVLLAPIIPGLTDEEIPRLLQDAKNAGARSASMILLRLPHGVKDIFTQWLEAYLPERKEKILHQLQATRGGKLYRSDFGSRMSGSGLLAEQIQKLFAIHRKKCGLEGNLPLSTAAFRRPGSQLSLFEE